MIGSIAFSPDSKKLAWAASNEFVGISQLFVWDIATARFEDLTNEKRWSAAIFGSEAKSLIAMDENGRNYYVWNLERRAVTSRVEFKRAWPGVQALALSPDGKILAIGGANSIGWHMRASRIRELGDIRLFDLASGKERLPPE